MMFLAAAFYRSIAHWVKRKLEWIFRLTTLSCELGPLAALALRSRFICAFCPYTNTQIVSIVKNITVWRSFTLPMVEKRYKVGKRSEKKRRGKQQKNIPLAAFEKVFSLCLFSSTSCIATQHDLERCSPKKVDRSVYLIQRNRTDWGYDSYCKVREMRGTMEEVRLGGPDWPCGVWIHKTKGKDGDRSYEWEHGGPKMNETRVDDNMMLIKSHLYFFGNICFRTHIPKTPYIYIKRRFLA